MAHSYTPGLKVAEKAHIVKRRILPIKGQVLVEVGAVLKPDDVVAKTDLPGDVYPVNIANLLGISGAEVKAAMLKQVGEQVTIGERIAMAKSFFGIFKSTATAPQAGTIESISSITGQVILRGAPQPVTVKSYISGNVTEVHPEEGVTVETAGSFIQGIFGVGGETHGTIKVMVKNRGDVLTAEDINDDVEGCVLIAGSMTTAGALMAAKDKGARAIITGGFEDSDLRNFLGYDLGVAITGHEDLGISLMVTEGFGSIDMAEKTFTLLKKREGMLASVNGATQIRAGVIRPEVVIPLDDVDFSALPSANAQGSALNIGDIIRCIRAPYFGRIGTVTALPGEPTRMESGTWVRVLELRFDDGETVVVPRANTERIESENGS